MSVTEIIWRERMNNLMERRAKGSSRSSNSKVGNYDSHLKKVKLYRTLLDVGCGDMSLERWLPYTVQYAGLDPFPVNDKVAFPHKIEDCVLPDNSYDTVVAFATLDGCRDLDKTLDNIKRIAAKNVVLLTGVDIPVDEYHTHEISLQYLDEKFSDWQQGYREELVKNVWLIEFFKQQ